MTWKNRLGSQGMGMRYMCEVPGETVDTSQPMQVPPSAGGTGLATISGSFIGWNTTLAIFQGEVPPLSAWLPALGLLVFVMILLGGMHITRKRLGVEVTPASLRRQWGLVGIGLLIGLLVGVGLAINYGAA